MFTFFNYIDIIYLIVTLNICLSDEVSTKRIFTSELIEGVPLDKCVDMDQATRNNICFLVLQLCLKELFEFAYMQTDPNWANFFYNEETKQVIIFNVNRSYNYRKLNNIWIIYTS